MPWRELRGGVGGLGRLGFGAWAFGDEVGNAKKGIHGAVEAQAGSGMGGHGALGAEGLGLKLSPGAARADGKEEEGAQGKPAGAVWA